MEDYEAPAVPLSAFSSRPAHYNQEAIDITLEPGEGMEYKYRLEPGGTLLFSLDIKRARSLRATQRTGWCSERFLRELRQAGRPE